MKTVSLILIFTTLLFSAQNRNGEEKSFEQEFPFNKNMQDIPVSIQEKRYKQNIDKDKVETTRKKLNKFRQIKKGTFDLAILQKPNNRVLKSVDTLYIHPEYITTIVFPKNLTISKPLSSFDSEIFFYSENVLQLQPMKNVSTGNINIPLSDGKKNYLMSIFIKRYFKDIECKQVNYNYLCANDYLATFYEYNFPLKLSISKKIKIIEEYKRTRNIKKLNLKKNLSHLKLEKNGETLFIIRDDEFGEIYTDGYSVSIKKSIN